MPRPFQEQINDLIGFVIPFAYMAIGFFMKQSAASLAESGHVSEQTAVILGYMFIAYGLLKLFWAFRKWKKNKEEL